MKTSLILRRPNLDGYVTQSFTLTSIKQEDCNPLHSERACNHAAGKPESAREIRVILGGIRALGAWFIVIIGNVSVFVIPDVARLAHAPVDRFITRRAHALHVLGRVGVVGANAAICTHAEA